MSKNNSGIASAAANNSEVKTPKQQLSLAINELDGTLNWAKIERFMDVPSGALKRYANGGLAPLKDKELQRLVDKMQEIGDAVIAVKIAAGLTQTPVVPQPELPMV